ncbi:MAG: TIGR00730 family Rossman fold protein, partial [Corynebacterium sp.]|nr:TIGR00730 family Rossman fold protein [Corynebacterium sp.]
PMLAETTLPKLREELPQLAAGREQPQRALSSLTVFCGSGFGNDLAWRVTAERLGQTLAKNRVELVYGGAAIGLMGTVANAALDDGGSVTGVIPEVLVKKEIAHPRLTHLETVATMADRKSRMYELGDAFVALPGGAGTLEEFFEVWTQQHLGIHAKPVALLGPSGFWEPLLALLRKVVDAGFVRPELLDALIVVDDVDKLLPALIAWRAGRTKF